MTDENKYENETCEGCVFIKPKARSSFDQDWCNLNEKSVPASRCCDHFKPNLSCRQVRVWEKLVDLK